MALRRRAEPAWHRNLRKRRQRARAFIAEFRWSPLVRASKQKLRRAIGVLGRHHTYNFLELPASIQSYSDMTWYCQTCKINNGPQYTYCKQCQAHWSEVWHASKRRSRSKSQRRQQQRAVAKETTDQKETMAVFPDKVPWVVSTPMSRINSKTGANMSGQGKDAEGPQSTVSTSAETLETSVVLTDDEARVLQSLRSLQSTNMELTEAMGKQLEVLSAKEMRASNSKALTHGHLNRLHRLKNQVSTSAQKIVDLDKEWKAFTARTMSKVKEHALLYQQCRADLMEVHNQKRSELMAVKEELSTASQSLIGQAQMAVEVPDTPDIAEAMQSFQDVISEEGTVGAIDLTEMDEDDEPIELDATGSKKTAKSVRPFRGATSPTKVASLHLKVKSDHKDAREVRKEEK